MPLLFLYFMYGLYAYIKIYLESQPSTSIDTSLRKKTNLECVVPMLSLHVSLYRKRPSCQYIPSFRLLKESLYEDMSLCHGRRLDCGQALGWLARMPVTASPSLQSPKPGNLECPPPLTVCSVCSVDRTTPAHPPCSPFAFLSFAHCPQHRLEPFSLSFYLLPTSLLHDFVLS